MDFSNTRKKQKHNIRFPMPDIPRDLWCDFRIDFVEHNLTLVQLAEKYHCDPRTVKSCISHNKSSYQLGQKSTPTRIQLYEKQIYDLLFHNKESIPPDVSTVYALSQLIYPLLKEHGYSGSERTLRNHLQKQPYVKALLEQQQAKAHPEPEKETL